MPETLEVTIARRLFADAYIELAVTTEAVRGLAERVKVASEYCAKRKKQLDRALAAAGQPED